MSTINIGFNKKNKYTANEFGPQGMEGNLYETCPFDQVAKQFALIKLVLSIVIY